MTLNGATATDMGNIPEPEIIEVSDITLPDAIVVPTNDRQNETRTVYSGGWTEFYFRATESDPLPINYYGTAKYSFTTGGLYLNGAEDPMSIGGFRKLEDKQYYIEVGSGELLEAGDTVTLKGTVKVGDICVAFQETKFYVDENSHIALLEHDPASPYESTLDDVYVDLGDLGDDVYAIPEANSITVDGTPIDATTTEGRTLSTAGDYAVVREDGYVTYKQNVICYEIGDANADGDLNVVDLIALKIQQSIQRKQK